MKRRNDAMQTLELIHAQTRQAYNLAAQRYHDLFHDEMNEKPYDRQLLDAFTGRFAPHAIILDAGCGPSGHIGRYVYACGALRRLDLEVIGVDISDQCVELARRNHPGMRFERGDLADLPFDPTSFDGIIAYYSIIHTPKRYVSELFAEFHRLLKPGGFLLVAVKAGETEGYVANFLETEAEIYFSLFTLAEIRGYFDQAGFLLEFLEQRNPYDFEISNERIFAIGKKASPEGLPGAVEPAGYFLRSPRLGFRRWQASDFHLALALWGDPQVTRLIDARGQLSPEQVQQRLEKEIATQQEYGVQYWPIFLLESGEHIGCCGLRPYDLPGQVYEIGFHIRSAHWRQGYAIEAARAVIDYAFRQLGAKALFAGHNPNNQASRALLLKLGFRYTHDEYYPPTGLQHPSYLLAVAEYTGGRQA
ncbi:MAG: GNAT family N-acetyltransferase [Chloroflexota bacterium]